MIVGVPNCIILSITTMEGVGVLKGKVLILNGPKIVKSPLLTCQLSCCFPKLLDVFVCFTAFIDM
jgi:hypothetical protein